VHGRLTSFGLRSTAIKPHQLHVGTDGTRPRVPRQVLTVAPRAVRLAIVLAARSLERVEMQSLQCALRLRDQKLSKPPDALSSITRSLERIPAAFEVHRLGAKIGQRLRAATQIGRDHQPAAGVPGETDRMQFFLRRERQRAGRVGTARMSNKSL